MSKGLIAAALSKITSVGVLAITATTATIYSEKLGMSFDESNDRDNAEHIKIIGDFSVIELEQFSDKPDYLMSVNGYINNKPVDNSQIEVTEYYDITEITNDGYVEFKLCDELERCTTKKRNIKVSEFNNYPMIITESDYGFYQFRPSTKDYQFMCNDTGMYISDEVLKIRAYAPYRYNGYNIAKVNKISEYACYGVQALMGVELEEGIEEIGDFAFSAVVSGYGRIDGGINFPSSITNIGRGAFHHMQLTSITFSPNSKLRTIEEEAFFLGETSQNIINNIVFPDSLVSIGNNAFRGQKIKSIKFGKNMDTIGNYSFYNGATQELIFTSKTTVKIGLQAFYMVVPLKKIVFIEDTKIQYSLDTGLELLVITVYTDYKWSNYWIESKAEVKDLSEYNSEIF